MVRISGYSHAISSEKEGKFSDCCSRPFGIQTARLVFTREEMASGMESDVSDCTCDTSLVSIRI